MGTQPTELLDKKGRQYLEARTRRSSLQEIVFRPHAGGGPCRTTQTIENYVDGTVSDTDDKTVEVECGPAGQTKVRLLLTGGDEQTTEKNGTQLIKTFCLNELRPVFFFTSSSYTGGAANEGNGWSTPGQERAGDARLH